MERHGGTKMVHLDGPTVDVRLPGDSADERAVLEAVLQQLPAGVLVSDARGRTLFCNELAEVTLGPPAVGDDGHITYTARRPDGLPYDNDELPLARSLATGETVEAQELPVLRPDGQQRILTVSASPVRRPDGRLHCAVVVFVDVTESREHQDERTALLRRVSRLQTITAALTEARTSTQVLDVVLNHVVEDVDARAGCIALLGDDGGSLELAGSVGLDQQTLSNRPSFDLDAPLPLAEAARRKSLVRYPSPEALLAAYPHMKPTLTRGAGAWVALPMLSEDRLVGTMQLSFADARAVGDAEEVFLSAVAAQCAQALDRARLYEAEAAARAQAEASRARLSFLAEASRVLAASLDPDETLSSVTDLAVPRLADWCAVSLLEEEGNLVTRAVAHVDPSTAAEVQGLLSRWPPRLDAPVGAGAVARTGRSELYRLVTDETMRQAAVDEEHLDAMRRIGLGAAMIVALRARGRVLGTMTLANQQGRSIGEADLALAEEAATRAAVAIDNARLFAARSDIARRLQHSLLPPRLAEVPGMEVGAAYVAGGTGVDVGGDFYDLLQTGPDRWLLVIGDVRGRGVDAAAVTGLARHTIRAVATASAAPGEVLEHLNRALRRADEERVEGDVEPRFATVCAVVVDVSGVHPRLQLCSAGHPLPYRLRADGGVEVVGKPGMLVGVFDEPELYDVRSELLPGDALVCVTDGVLERRWDGALFEDRLPAVLSASQGLGAEALADRVRSEAEAFSSDSTDDMAVIVLRMPTVAQPAGPGRVG